MKKTLFGFLVGLIFIQAVVSAGLAEAAFAFPEKGKVGLYSNSIGDGKWRTILYFDSGDRFVQVVSWHNGACQDAVTACVNRGWGEFLVDGSLLIHLFYRGNTIAPDESTSIGDFRIFPNGTVTSSWGWNFSVDLLFFGTSPEDGVYFTQQWGCTPPGENGQPCKMRLLDENVGPWHLDWDLEVISITDAQGDTYFVLPAIGPGRVGMEYGWVLHSHTGDGIRHRGNPLCPTWIFDEGTPYCAGADVVLPYGDGWWLKSPFEDMGIVPVTWINGRDVRATTRDQRILEEYKRRGPVCWDPTIPGCFPE